MDICRFDGGDCCERNLIGNGVCDEVNNFESCGNFDGGDCIMIKGPAIYGKVTAKPSTTTEETVSQLILNQIKTNKSQKSSVDIEIYGGKESKLKKKKNHLLKDYLASSYTLGWVLQTVWKIIVLKMFWKLHSNTEIDKKYFVIRFAI